MTVQKFKKNAEVCYVFLLNNVRRFKIYLFLLDEASVDGLFDNGLAGWGAGEEICLLFQHRCLLLQIKNRDDEKEMPQKSNHQPFGTDEDGPLHSFISP